MAKTKFTDSEILNAMTMLLDYDSVVFGANGHYANGAFYNLYENYKDAEETDAAKAWVDSVDDTLAKSLWLYW